MVLHDGGQQTAVAGNGSSSSSYGRRAMGSKHSSLLPLDLEQLQSQGRLEEAAARGDRGGGQGGEAVGNGGSSCGERRRRQRRLWGTAAAGFS